MAKNYWAWEIQGTILETPKDKEKKSGGFLTPWTSLLPDHLKKKLAPDVLAMYKNGQLKFFDKDTKAFDFPYWGVIFPKRSYLPPDYPHLQLWLLGNYFSPSLYFVHQQERQDLIDVVDIMLQSGDRYAENIEGAVPTLAINATPFSFIKKKDGKYYGGGQSVRTFHLHYLLRPGQLESKHEFTEKEAALVYPTTFAHELFQLVFLSPGLQEYILGQTEKIKVTDRGVGFNVQGDSNQLIEVLSRLDEVFYQLQLSLIYSFYTDSSHFLDKVSEFMKIDNLSRLEQELDNLILLGKERELEKTKKLLVQELERFGKKYNAGFLSSQIKTVVNQLTVEQESKDLSSWVGKQKVVLRPGMGYGLFAEKAENGFRVHVAPEDSLESEGTMESNGFYFTDKIKVTKKPKWFSLMKDYLAEFSS